MTQQKQISILVTERLGQAIAEFDTEELSGFQCDERVAAVLEAVNHAHAGLITSEEMVTKIEAALGGKFETDADFDQMGARLDGSGEASEESTCAEIKAAHASDARLSFASAGATRQR